MDEIEDEDDSIIVAVNEVVATLEIEYDIDVDPVTVRRRGFTNRGYYEKKYADACDYNQMGDNRFRGMLIKPKKFLEEVET